MSSLEISFENELKLKLSQKTRYNLSEGTILLNAFKFYDLANSGCINRDQWIKSLSKIGLSGYSNKDLSSLFDIYDTNHKGVLDYKRFILNLFTDDVVERVSKEEKFDFNMNNNLKINTHNTNKPIDISSQSTTQIDEIISKIRITLALRGIKGILIIKKAFRIIDNECKGYVDMYDFHKTLRDYGLDVSNEELRIIFENFDKTKSGLVDYQSFLHKVRGSMNSYRKNIVENIINSKFSSSQVIYFDDIKDLYLPNNHPEVLLGKRSVDDVMLEFLQTFDLNHSLSNGKNLTSKILKEELVEYYENLSMSIQDDTYFATLVNNSWKSKSEFKNFNMNADENEFKNINMNKNRNAKMNEFKNENLNMNKIKNEVINTKINTDSDANSKNKHLTASLIDNIKKFRQKIISRGSRGIYSLQRALKIGDQKNTHVISYQDFKIIIEDFRMNLNEEEIFNIFQSFDYNKIGKINYLVFLKGLIGEMNESRKNMVKKVFYKLDKNKINLIEVGDIKNNFNAGRHPDVIAGRRTEDDILAEWLDSFDQFYFLKDESFKRDRKMPLEEILEYYNHISMLIEDDRYFELMLNNCWNLDNKRNFSNSLMKNTLQYKYNF